MNDFTSMLVTRFEIPSSTQKAEAITKEGAAPPTIAPAAVFDPDVANPGEFQEVEPKAKAQKRSRAVKTLKFSTHQPICCLFVVAFF